MKIFTVSLIILTSCTYGGIEESDSKKEDAVVTNSHSIKENTPKIDAENLFEFIENYNETGDKSYLQPVLSYYELGLQENYVGTFTPLYCGLIHELTGDSDTAIEYYEQTKQLAKSRIENPLDGIEYEFDVKSEKELIELFEEARVPFNMDDFKAKKIVIQTYFLLLSQIALGENKNEEFNELIRSENNLERTFIIPEIAQREDIFHLITGWEK